MKFFGAKMKIRLLILLPLLILFVTFSDSYSQAINSKDLTVAVKAEVGKDPQPFITLKWINNPKFKVFQIFKKLASEKAFPGTPIIQLDSGIVQWTDLNVEIGKTYEYGILATSRKTITLDPNIENDMIFVASGYTLAGIEVIPELSRGICLVLVDSLMKDLIIDELNLFKEDLAVDGWDVIVKSAPRAVTFDAVKVKATKKLIIDTYTEKKNLTSIILLGRVPVPYSGNFAPDAHPDHVGAWPADVYYGTIDELSWTDITINNSTATRVENKNIPGDGKFDITTLSTFTNVNFAVGRIDMYDMPLFHDSTKSNPEAELLKKYLMRNHLYRTNQIDFEWKGLVDDNFGAQSYPEAFAASGWRAFTNFLEFDSVKADDYMTILNTNTYLWSYGCGGGSYVSAGGIGNSTNFSTNKNNGLFTLLFGSYFGDWDIRNNFLRSALASSPGALTIGWSGRPHWFLHHMNFNEPIGTSLLATQNNNNVYYPNIYYSKSYPSGVLYTSGTRQVHISLLGDPTLKMFNNSVDSPRDLQLTQFQNNNVKLTWKEPSKPGTYLYAIYRSLENGVIELLTKKPISLTQFTDELTSLGKRTYYVKALKLGTARSGSFYFSSNPIFSQIDVVGVEEELISQLTVSPNPAATFVKIQFNFATVSTKVEITDLQGNLVNTFYFNDSGSQGQLIWDLKDRNGVKVNTGIYLIKIDTGKDLHLEKVIIH